MGSSVPALHTPSRLMVSTNALKALASLPGCVGGTVGASNTPWTNLHNIGWRKAVQVVHAQLYPLLAPYTQRLNQDLLAALHYPETGWTSFKSSKHTPSKSCLDSISLIWQMCSCVYGAIRSLCALTHRRDFSTFHEPVTPLRRVTLHRLNKSQKFV